MEVICLEEEAFYELVNKVVEKVKPESNPIQKRWLTASETMELLGIKSRTTLQKIRDGGKIRFSKPQSKIIMYDRESIEAYLDQHARNTF